MRSPSTVVRECDPERRGTLQDTHLMYTIQIARVAQISDKVVLGAKTKWPRPARADNLFIKLNKEHRGPVLYHYHWGGSGDRPALFSGRAGMAVRTHSGRRLTRRDARASASWSIETWAVIDE